MNNWKNLDYVVVYKNKTVWTTVLYYPITFFDSVPVQSLVHTTPGNTNETMPLHSC